MFIGNEQVTYTAIGSSTTFTGATRGANSTTAAAHDSGVQVAQFDRGAIPFLLNGADCMMAGIQDCDRDITKNDLVWIRDETHKKPIAVGWALSDGKNMINSNSGKGISTIHWIGDELWNLEL